MQLPTQGLFGRGARFLLSRGLLGRFEFPELRHRLLLADAQSLTVTDSLTNTFAYAEPDSHASADAASESESLSDSSRDSGRQSHAFADAPGNSAGEPVSGTLDSAG